MDNSPLTNIHLSPPIPNSSKSKKTLTFYSNSISINRHRVTNGSIRTHFHDCFELEINLNGDATNIINGLSYPIRKNSFYLLSPADIHKLEVPSTVDIISIKFTDSPLSKGLLKHLNIATYPIIGEFSDTQLETILSPILNLRSTTDSFSNETYRDIYARSVVEMLLSVVLDQSQNTESGTTSPHEMFSLLSYVKNHFRENIPLAMLAKQYGYNTNYLRSKFRQLTGKTYVTFVNDERLTYAYQLIELTDMQISEISNSAGFQSLSYFSRIFKAKYGISPINLRFTLKNQKI